ncbi:MAG: right-handed parallel beta-helix repeat-containing protein [bacterium]|nr:right-handed parallel beta-helix repeat-containing protein [bacterium]
MLIIKFVILIFGFFNLAECDTYFVRTDGSDLSGGKENTSTGAFRTIQKAADIVKPGDIVLIQQGIYEEQIFLNVSGTKEQPIVFQGEGSVVIDGESEIPSKAIKIDASGIWNVDIPGVSVRDTNTGLAGVWLNGKQLQEKNNFTELQASKGSWFCEIKKEENRVILHINPSEGTLLENSVVRIRRKSCFSVAGNYNHLINLECKNAQTNIISTGGNYCIIENCRVHNNYPASNYAFLSGIQGPGNWTIKNSEVFQCGNNGICLEGGGTIIGNKIYENKNAGVYLRVYKNSPVPVVKNNIFKHNPVAFTTYPLDAGQKIVFEYNECIGNGISFANGTFTVQNNIFRETKDAITLTGGYGKTDVLIIHNLFLNCNQAIAIYGDVNLFSDENVFSPETIVSRWQSQEMVGGSWLESSLAATGDLATWQKTSGQDSNSLIGNSLSIISPSSVFVKNLKINPVLSEDGLFLNFKGSLICHKSMPGQIHFFVKDPSGKEYIEKQDVLLVSEDEIEFNKDVGIPCIEGEFICRFNILDEKGNRIGQRFVSLRNPSATDIEMLNPSYKKIVFSTQKDKEVRIKITLDTKESVTKKLKLQAGLKLSDDTRIKFLQEITPDTENILKFPVSGLKYGVYEILVNIIDLKGNVIDRAKTDFRYIETKPQTVRIDTDGNILVDEKPFFPIGVHGNTGTKEDLQMFAQAGFNVTTAFDVNKDFMDEAYKLGIKIVLLDSLANTLSKTVSKEQKEKLFQKAKGKVEEFKNHPALLCYLWGEELVWQQEYVALYEQTSLLDPYHPFAMNGSFRGYTSLYYISDIMMNHLYPYPMYGDDQDILAKKFLTTADRCSSMIEIANGKIDKDFPGPKLSTGKKPWWLWPQYFYGGHWARGSGYSGYGRFLTLCEIRNQVWAAIARGAKGILFWAYFHDYTNPRMNPKLWEAVRALGNEVRSLEKVLVQPETNDEVVSCEKLSISSRRYGKNLYVIAVYHGAQNKEISFELKDKGISQLFVWSEKRSIAVKNGMFTDMFKPLDVHIYTTEKPGDTIMEKFLSDAFFMSSIDYRAKPGNIAASQNGSKAKSSRNYTWYPHCNFAIDGDPDTCWFPLYDGKLSPSFVSPAGKTPEWLEVEFPEPKKISKIVIRSYKPRYWPDPDCVLSDFDIEAWDDKEWKPVKSITGNTNETITLALPSLTTSKVRLVVKKGLYLSELEVY